MDIVSTLNCGCVIGILILPAWAVLRLPRLAVSIPIGTLIFWTWLFLPGVILRESDPDYDSMGPAFAFLFGLPWGFFYCGIWAIVRKGVPRLNKPRRPGTVLDVVIWSGIALLCASFPWLVSAKYHRDVAMDLGYTLFGAGPLLLLAVAMAWTSFSSLPKRDRSRLSLDKTPLGLATD
jgi:hypothetical protein